MPGVGESDPSLLAVILDASASTWASSFWHSSGGQGVANSRSASGASGAAGPPKLEEWMTEVSAFLKAFLLLHGGNRLAVIACGSYSSAFLVPSFSSPAPPSGGTDPSAVDRAMTGLSDFLEQEIAAAEIQLEGASPEHMPHMALLAASLSMGLTYVVKAMRTSRLGEEPQPRILCIFGGTDSPQQYVAIMNAIFSSQKQKVPIDSLIFSPSDSAFLQQAAFLTEGSYWRLRGGQSLFQFLTLVFGPDTYSRAFLHLPKPSGVDFRAACFCHKKTVDLGYVCSVCLSIFCSRLKKCATCGAAFTPNAARIEASSSLRGASK